MDYSQNHSGAKQHLGRLIHKHRASILKDWCRRVRLDPEIPHSEVLELPKLYDHIPDLVDALAQKIAERSSHSGREDEAIQHHVAIRSDEGYDVTEALREISHLRSAIISHCITKSPDGFALLEASLDNAMIHVAAGLTTANLDKERALCQAKQVFEETLAADQERLSLALTSAKMVCWEWQVAKDQLTIVGDAKSLYGVDLDLSGGGLNAWIGAIHADDKERVKAVIEQAICDHQPYSVEYRVAWPNGTIHWLMANGQPHYREGGKLQRVLAVSTDISTSREAKEELRHARDNAEAANLAKSQFLANMSHEIRTPLGAIIGFSTLMKETNLSAEERLKYLEIVERNGRSLATLIDDILDLSKVEAGHLEVENCVMSLPHLLQDVTELLSYKALEKKLSLRVLIDGYVPATIRSDPARLRQILINVLSNALKFTGSGSVVICVKLQQHNAQGSTLAFAVTDTGPGISVIEREKLFHPFSQADNSTTRKYGGTGLGLALSRRLAKALRGDLELTHSEQGKGSTFTVTVEAGPLDSVTFIKEYVQPKQDPTAQPLKDHRFSLQGIKVLLAEDSPDNQILIKSVLTYSAATVQIASNGLDAVQAALHGDFDLILMDIQMPLLDGYGATEKLRANGFTKPIIALTAHAMREELERSLRVGCNDHLVKPLEPGRLIETILDHVKKTRAVSSYLE